MRKLLNIPYGLDLRQKIDFYLPDTTARAAAIWFHGGGITGGDKENYAFLAENLTSSGIALILPGYRLIPNVAFPDFVNDAAAAAACALDSLKEQGINGPVLLGGSSAGAYLSMMLCFDRHYLARHGKTPEDISAYFFNSAQPTAHYNILKQRGEDFRAIVVDETAPLYFVRDDKPQRHMLILCADNDMYSRRTQNILMRETLMRFGHSKEDVQFETLNGYGHCGYDSKLDSDGRYILENRIIMLLNKAMEVYK